MADKLLFQNPQDKSRHFLNLSFEEINMMNSLGGSEFMYKVFEVILWDCVWRIFHTFFAFLSLFFSNSATSRPEDTGNSSMDRFHSCCLELFIFTPILGKQKFTKPCSVWIKLMITPFPGGHDYKVRWQVLLLTNISPSLSDCSHSTVNAG